MALELGIEDDVFETEEEGVFIVERKKTPGVYGFCNGIPEDTLEVYLVLKDSEEKDTGRAPDHKIDGFLIFRE